MWYQLDRSGRGVSGSGGLGVPSCIPVPIRLILASRTAASGSPSATLTKKKDRRSDYPYRLRFLYPVGLAD